MIGFLLGFVLIVTAGLLFLIHKVTEMWKVLKLHNNMIASTACYIGHLYALADLLSRSQASFVQQQLYISLRTQDPRTLNLVAENGQSGPAIKANSKEYLLQVKDILIQEYQKSRETLLGVIQKEVNVEEKKYLQELLEEFDGPFNLLSTLDKESSVEYADNIQKNIDHSMKKLLEKIQQGSNHFLGGD